MYFCIQFVVNQMKAQM